MLIEPDLACIATLPGKEIAISLTSGRSIIAKIWFSLLQRLNKTRSPSLGTTKQLNATEARKTPSEESTIKLCSLPPCTVTISVSVRFSIELWIIDTFVIKKPLLYFLIYKTSARHCSAFFLVSSVPSAAARLAPPTRSLPAQGGPRRLRHRSPNESDSRPLPLGPRADDL